MCENIFCNKWQQSTICDSKWYDVEDARESNRYSSSAEGVVAAIWNQTNTAIQMIIMLAMTYFYPVPTRQKTVTITIASPPLPLIQTTLLLLYFTPLHPPCPFLPHPTATHTPQPTNNDLRRLRREQCKLRRQARLNEPIEESLLHIRNNINNNVNGADADSPGSCTQIHLYRIMNVALLPGTLHHAELVKSG